MDEARLNCDKAFSSWEIKGGGASGQIPEKFILYPLVQCDKYWHKYKLSSGVHSFTYHASYKLPLNR